MKTIKLTENRIIVVKHIQYVELIENLGDYSMIRVNVGMMDYNQNYEDKDEARALFKKAMTAIEKCED